MRRSMYNIELAFLTLGQIPAVDLRFARCAAKSLSTETRMCAGIRPCSYLKSSDGMPSKWRPSTHAAHTLTKCFPHKCFFGHDHFWTPEGSLGLFGEGKKAIKNGTLQKRPETHDFLNLFFSDHKTRFESRSGYGS